MMDGHPFRQEALIPKGNQPQAAPNPTDSPTTRQGEVVGADRPIIFSAPMVRALIEGRKTQTRRILKAPHGVDPDHWMPNTPGRLGAGISGDRFAVLHWPNDGAAHAWGKLPCQAGDRIWVRETAAVRYTGWHHVDGHSHAVSYAADENEHGQFIARRACGGGIRKGEAPTHFPQRSHNLNGKLRWASPIHMPRWASRLTLLVAEVRVERLQDISETDAIAEGVDPICDHGVGNPNLHGIAFEQLWERLHGEGAWRSNPWVAVISFTVHRANIDAVPLPSSIIPSEE